MECHCDMTPIDVSCEHILMRCMKCGFTVKLRDNTPETTVDDIIEEAKASIYYACSKDGLLAR